MPEEGKSVTNEFIEMLKDAENKIEMVERMEGVEYARSGKAMQEGINLYVKALALETNNAECILRANRGLANAYHKI